MGWGCRVQPRPSRGSPGRGAPAKQCPPPCPLPLLCPRSPEDEAGGAGRALPAAGTSAIQECVCGEQVEGSRFTHAGAGSLKLPKPQQRSHGCAGRAPAAQAASGPASAPQPPQAAGPTVRRADLSPSLRSSGGAKALPEGKRCGWCQGPANLPRQRAKPLVGSVLGFGGARVGPGSPISTLGWSWCTWCRDLTGRAGSRGAGGRGVDLAWAGSACAGSRRACEGPRDAGTAEHCPVEVTGRRGRARPEASTSSSEALRRCSLQRRCTTALGSRSPRPLGL